MFSGLQRELNLWPLRYCQCSTNWAMKTHTLGAGQFIEFIVPVKGMKHISIMWTADIQMKWRCDHCSCDYDLSNRKLSWKSFWTFNGIWTCGLCLSAAVLHHLSYKDLYVGSRPIYWVHRPRERNETVLYELRTYKYDHRSCDCSANTEATGSNPVEAPKTFFGLNLRLLKS